MSGDIIHTILRRGFLVLTAVFLQTAKAAPTVPPFVIATDDNGALPTLSEEELWQKSVAVTFAVNKFGLQGTDPGWQALQTVARELQDTSYSLCRLIMLRGSASPEGPYANNQRLAHLRAQTITDSLRHYITIPDSAVHERFVAEDYFGLRQLMLASDAPYSKTVIDIINQGKDDAAIKVALKRLQGGRVWQQLLKTYFPQLRAVRVLLVVAPKQQPKPEVVTPVVPEIPTEEPADTIAETKEVVAVPTVQEATAIQEEAKAVYQPMFNLKTNLLYDLALYVPQYGWAPTPNVALEFLPRGGHITAVAEWTGTGWRSDRKNKTWILRNILLEGRYYFKARQSTIQRSGTKQRNNKTTFEGHYLSAYAHTGEFDIQFSPSKAWLNDSFGKSWGVGVGWGYVKRIGNSPLKWEVNAAIGFLRAPYDGYHPAESWANKGNFYYDWHNDPRMFVRQRNTYKYFGPTRIGFSISYDLPWPKWKAKKGGER